MALRTVARTATTTARRAVGARSVATLPDLPYGYGELEPVISGEIMELHHSKHHNTYVTNLNVATEKLAEATEKGDVTTIVQMQAAIKFNGGGHLNHSIFWQNLAPPSKGGGGEPDGELAALINAKFGSFDAMKTQLSGSTVAVQGSGWGWLGYDKATNSVAIATCPNQDPLEATTGLVPLFGIDVWEHAYYLDYKNVRPDYVNAIWELANWEDVAARLAAAK
eukprot:CAMPEP_0182558140 /NCGR_PEP_ID=MMETSP1324-20130603/1812_1 /TAXON_ID=236786 /ORGANISM="Florenciella sp., Strain RCC1587" /LENGTH=222 /DNA_ID=CAMNT_0024770305 /DNA_START=38 /DNA_END=706 /DNA_ORIENTATION=+